MVMSLQIMANKVHKDILKPLMKKENITVHYWILFVKEELCPLLVLTKSVKVKEKIQGLTPLTQTPILKQTQALCHSRTHQLHQKMRTLMISSAIIVKIVPEGCRMIKNV